MDERLRGDADKIVRASIAAVLPDEAVKRALCRRDLHALCQQAVNVFEDATALAGVAVIRRKMEAFSPLCSQMTGSGSCVFAIFEDEDTANACVKALKMDYTTAFVCQPCDGVIIE